MDATDERIDAINRDANIALTESGETLAVTNWLDNDGNECAAEDADLAVVGPTIDGRWHTVCLSEFEDRANQ